MRSDREVVGSMWFRLSSKGTAAVAILCCVGWLSMNASPVAAQGTFGLTSSDLRDGGTIGHAQIYDQNGCNGNNASPQLSWRNAPAGTKSFAVTVFDIDAPGPGWWHWAVAEIPPGTQSLPTNASRSGYVKKIGAIEARNDWGDVGYGGPCPPPGKPHRYVVTVFALDTMDLRLGPARHALMFDHEINTAALAKASLTVTFGR